MSAQLHRALQGALYLSSWVGLLLCFIYGNPGPYFFITAVETHLSVPAPLGQCIPVLDVTTNFFHVHARVLSGGFLLVFAGRMVCWDNLRCCEGHSVCTQAATVIVSELLTNDTWWWAACSVLLFGRAYKSRHICSELKESFHRIDGFPQDWFLMNDSASLHRLPWYARCHPFLFNCTSGAVTGLSGSVSVVEYDITDMAIACTTTSPGTGMDLQQQSQQGNPEQHGEKLCGEVATCENVEVSMDVSTSLLDHSDPHVPSSSSSSSFFMPDSEVLEPLLVDVWFSSSSSRCVPNSGREMETESETGTVHVQKPIFLFLHGGGWLGVYREATSECIAV